MPTAKTFHATLGADGDIEIPFDVRAEFGKARPPVNVTIRGVTFRWTVAVYGGKYFLGLRRELREQMGVKAGEKVNVRIELDVAPRTVEPPPELQAALDTDPAAKAAWGRLSFTHKREHAEAIVGAKKPETRERRVAKCLEMLHSK